MIDNERFQTVNDLKAYADRIPNKAFLRYGYVCRSYDGFLHCEFSFIEDDALLPIYALKQKGKGRIFDGVLLILLSFFLSSLWTMIFLLQEESPFEDICLLLVLPLASFVAGVLLIAFGKRLCRRHESLLNGYLRK
jgi:hypothetical protein